MRTVTPVILLPILLFVAGCAGKSPGEPEGSVMASSPAPASVAYAQFTETIEGTAVSFDMMPVAPSVTTGIAPFWIGRTEVTWDAYDVFIYGLDQAPETGQADAVTRPSKPYISMDRGFGHAGWPVISVSYRGAEAFCAWLSQKTGRRYRLPTEREWRHACERGDIDPAQLGEHAWYRENSDFQTHPVGTRKGDRYGLQDLFGNALEWATGDDGAPVTLGGCYRDSAADVGCGARVLPTPAWNQSDPQIPKSIWWLADGGFVGFRVLCEPQPEPAP